MISHNIAITCMILSKRRWFQNPNYDLKFSTAYLSMSSLVENLSKEPVNPVITGEKDGIIFSWLLFQLDGYRYQLVVAIDVEQAYRSSAVVILLRWDSFQDLQITKLM